MKIRLDNSDSSLRKGHILDQKYSIKKILGIGGFGRTYLAESIWTQENFAIKEYFPNDWAVRSEDGISLRAFDETKRSFYEHGLSVFVNEAKILKNLREDDVVVDVKDFFYENNTGYIVMEYIQGCTLAQYMQKQNSIIPLDMAEVIIISVAKSMSKIHRLGLLHRDISPDNIMLLEDGSIKLIDFGATRQYALNETTDMSVMIKPGFAPMEQYSRTGKQGPWTDVYALAATYYFIVSGKRPLTAVDRCAAIPTSSCSSRNSYRFPIAFSSSIASLSTHIRYSYPSLYAARSPVLNPPEPPRFSLFTISLTLSPYFSLIASGAPSVDALSTTYRS